MCRYFSYVQYKGIQKELPVKNLVWIVFNLTDLFLLVISELIEVLFTPAHELLEAFDFSGYIVFLIFHTISIKSLVGTLKLILPPDSIPADVLRGATGFIFPEHLVLTLLLPKVLQLVIDPRKLSKALRLVGLKFEFVDSVLDCVLIFHTISIRESE